MVFPAGIEEISKLTNPRVIRLLFRPARISIVVLPPPLLDWKPSKLDAAERVIVKMVGVGLGVGVAVGFGVGVDVGFFVGVGLLSASSFGVGVEVADSVGVGEGSSEEFLLLNPK